MVTTKRRLDGAGWTSSLFMMFTVAFAAFLVPNDVTASASGIAAAAPTFSTPCFTSATIQQTGTYTVPATGVTTVRAVLRGQNGGRGGYSGGLYVYNGGTAGGKGPRWSWRYRSHRARSCTSGGSRGHRAGRQ